jgi:hypothetical protein
MLKLNTDEIRNLQFEVSIQGINYDELQGSLKFIIEDVEYGIPVKIQRDLVSVEVPPLEEIVARGMKNGDVVECKLDIFGNGFYINPWGGQFELATPVKMEAKRFNIDNKQPEKKVIAELKEPEFKSKEVLDKESILEMLFEKLEEKGFKTDGYKEPKIIKEEKSYTPPKQVSKKQLTREELVEQKIKSKFANVNSLVKSVKALTETKKVIRNPKTKASIVKESNFINTDMTNIMQKVQELKNRSSNTKPTITHSTPVQRVEQEITIDHNDPIVLMESVGMKNPKIQQTMLAKAIELGGDGDKSIAETLKKLLGIGQTNVYEQYMNMAK